MSNLLTTKLRRDLRATWPRFVLMTIAIAISLTVFGGMLNAWASIGRETSAGYMSTAPASATIVLEEPVEAGRLQAIAAEARERPGIIEATARTQFTSVTEVNGVARNLATQTFVAAADDPMRVAKFDVQREGSWPPPPGRVYLKADSLPLLGAEVGDTLTVKGPSGQPLHLRIAGTTYDPSLAPAPQEQKAYAYLSAASLSAAGQPVRFDQVKLQVSEPGQTVPTENRDTVVARASEVGEWLQRDHGLTIDEIQVPTPYAHPHEWQADVLLLSLLAGGAAALLLSTILVANMLNNLFTQQIPQIGIMKAVGAGSGRIGRFYLAMTLLIAAAATLLAVGPATWIGQGMLGWLLAMLGIEPVSLVAPWWTYAVIVAVGLFLPPLMALVPLVRTSRTTVRAAIDHHGTGSKPSRATGVLAGLSRVRRFDRGLLMALRNTVRRPARFWLSVSLLASAGAVFVAGMSLSDGTEAVNEERAEQRYWDVDVTLAGPAGQDAVTTALRQVPDITRVEAWYQVQVGLASPDGLPVTRTYPDEGHGSIAANTVPANRSVAPPKLLEGRWLRPGETGAIVLNQIIRDSAVPGARAGDDVRMFVGGKSTLVRVVGIVEERESAGGGVYATAEGMAQATGQPPMVNQLRLVTKEHDEPARNAVADAAEETLTAAGVEVGLASSITRGASAAEAHMGPVLLVLLVVAVPLGIVGGIGLASTMSSNVLDRIREFGVMHAIGARPRSVRRIVIAEGIFLGLTSCLIAVLPALGLTRLLGVGLGNLFTNAPLPYRISVLAVGIWLALAILGSALATDAAATRASRVTVREALSYL